MKLKITLLIMSLVIVLLGGCNEKIDNSSIEVSSSAVDSSQESETSSSEETSETGLSETEQSIESVALSEAQSSSLPVSEEASSVQSSSISETSKEERIAEIMNGNIMKSDTYVLGTYVTPYWEGNVVYNESVYTLGNPDGSIDPIAMMYYADKIIDVRSPDLKTQYTEGVDYALEDGKIVILAGSAITIQSYSRFYLSSPIANKSFERLDGSYLFFSEGVTFHSRQIAVTYVHLDEWEGPVPEEKGYKLPKLLDKLRNKENVKIVFTGDSITQGANSSGGINVEPFAPKYIDMFCEQLSAVYGSTITSVNSSEGGQISAWGLLNIQSNVIDYEPDLVVIAFGMNDGTASNRVAPSTYHDNVLGMINAVRAVNPDCEFILISSMMPNPDLKLFTLYQQDYPAELLDIESSVSGVAVADVNEMHRYVMTKKRYFDMTGNNVNHPNDFVARLYTQTMMKTIRH